MCDAVRLPFSDFSADQVKRYQLDDYVSEYSTGGDLFVTFRHCAKPRVIPFLINGRIKLSVWDGHLQLHQLENGSLFNSLVMPVEIPAYYAEQNGIWFDVAPRRIRGALLPAQDRSRDDRIFILVKRSTDYFERMTNHDWEPVYVGEDADPLFNSDEFA
ncbi:hypothetical protein [Gimesia chilikensis]|uniref:hypothetical protein n=1 Tax=Gimesia chilikensis TaxID=2605989 RepID=UPI00118C6F25|nr:hypothetical protein [Gimesia chilikensis]QDT84600.1 hypothetical protein MalM14_22600 [Gimesia chilikensis]